MFHLYTWAHYLTNLVFSSYEFLYKEPLPVLSEGAWHLCQCLSVLFTIEYYLHNIRVYSLFYTNLKNTESTNWNIESKVVCTFLRSFSLQIWQCSSMYCSSLAVSLEKLSLCTEESASRMSENTEYFWISMPRSFNLGLPRELVGKLAELWVVRSVMSWKLGKSQVTEGLWNHCERLRKESHKPISNDGKNNLIFYS